MKLKQRIFLSFYILKFKTLELISPSAAAKSAFNLFCTPYSARKTYTVPGAFTTANKLSFHFQNHTIHGFQWVPEKSNSCKILICHGFDSHSYRFAKYIEPLLKEGFKIYAFDAPGHGVSSGKTINALLYSNMLVEATNLYGPFEGVIAHSFAGLAITLSLEKLSKSLPKRLVLIAPATETTSSLNDFCRHLKISQRMRHRIEDLIFEIGGQPPSWYSVARLVQQMSVSTLWLHDKSDRITPYEDMKHLVKLNLPHVEFVITEGLGHSLYRNEIVADAIIKFLIKLKTDHA